MKPTRHILVERYESNIDSFVPTRLTCEQMKAAHQRPTGLLQSLPLQEREWGHITIDFVVGLPRSKSQQNSFWVVIDRLTKSTFLSDKDCYLDKLQEIKICFSFLGKLQKAISIVPNFSTAFHQ